MSGSVVGLRIVDLIAIDVTPNDDDWTNGDTYFVMKGTLSRSKIVFKISTSINCTH